MGFRFRRSVRIAPGIRINFNAKSTSVRIGPRGLGYTFSSTGKKHVTAGIPGTGLSFTQTVAPARKAARALLDWNQDKLATESGLAASTIKRLENSGLAKASLENVDKISEALERAGIEFYNHGEPGVRLRRREASE